MASSLGEVLVDEGIITKTDLEEALSRRQGTQESLGDLLVRMGKLTGRDRVWAMSRLYRVPFVDVAQTPISPEVARLLPHATAVKLTSLPVERRGDALLVVMADPTDVTAIDEVSRATGLRPEPAIGVPEDILEAIFRVFGTGDDLSRVIEQALSDRESQPEEAEPESSAVTQLHELAEGPPIIRLVNVIVSQAIAERASDVHLEPGKEDVQVRIRVDGVLRETMTLPKDLQAATISRIKVMASMDIAERRAPQDGRLTLVAHPKEYDVRVSTYPGVFGESVVMRILDKSRSRIGLEQLGMPEPLLEQWKTLLLQPHGFLLVCGPTGSGKTTCLYAGLNLLNSGEKKIITIEDPVEYQIPGITQAHVNPRAGLTFASGLRSIVRQDPDVVMVGEIRDTETAEIAIHAALTGHLVLSTLHTNESAGAVSRLLEMGIEPFLMASSLVGVLSVRLVRLVCPACAQPPEPPPSLLDRLHLPAPHSPQAGYRQAAGCPLCTQTGYHGRSGIFELLVVDETIRDAIMSRASAAEIQARAVANGMTTLLQDAVERARRGETTVEEVLRVTASLAS